MEEIYLPVLSHFLNGNFWTASAGRMRYRVDPVEQTLAAQVWEGPYGYALSEVEEHTSFPLSEEGLEELRAWAAKWSETINARPKRSLAEELARREAAQARLDAAKAEEAKQG